MRRQSKVWAIAIEAQVEMVNGAITIEDRGPGGGAVRGVSRSE